MRLHQTLTGLAAVLVATGLLAGSVLAEPPASDGRPPFARGFGPGMMGMGGYADAAGIARLKADLAITKAQEPAWDTYAKILEEQASSMQAMRQGMDPEGVHAMAPEDRAKFMTQMFETRQAHFDALKTAAEHLLPSLSEFQRGKASAILPGLAAPGPRHAGMGGPMMGHGPFGH